MERKTSFTSIVAELVELVGLSIKTQWPSGLERWTGDQCSNPGAAASLRDFGNSVYPIMAVAFGGDAKIRLR